MVSGIFVFSEEQKRCGADIRESDRFDDRAGFAALGALGRLYGC